MNNLSNTQDQIIFGNGFDEKSIIRIKKEGNYIRIDANVEGMLDLSRLFQEFSNASKSKSYWLHLDPSSDGCYGQLTADSNGVVVSLLDENCN